jgi:hypothetical protein
MSLPGKRKLANGTLDIHFGIQMKERQKSQMEKWLLKEKAKAKTSYGSTTVTPKSSLPSARTDPPSDDDEVLMVKVKASPPKQAPSLRQEAEEKESQQRSLSDEENIPTRRNQNTAAIPTVAAPVPAVAAAPASPPRASPIIDLTGNESDPPSPASSVPSLPLATSPASNPSPPLATVYTLAEFEEMWESALEDCSYSTEEIEQGSLVRSGNSKVAVRKYTQWYLLQVESLCLETMHRESLARYTLHSPLLLCVSCMHSLPLDGRQYSTKESPIRSHLVWRYATPFGSGFKGKEDGYIFRYRARPRKYLLASSLYHWL